MMQPGTRSARATRLAWLLLPLLALVAVHPLAVHGCSCGHDFTFHLESWLDAAQQMRHGTLYPQWVTTAAWNAGEPRFVFYPPLSWMLGAVLTMLLPLNAAPLVFTWIALSGAGITMFFLARRFASTSAALLAGAVYLANPYLLFTAFERTAYAELLAAAWMPLVVLAALEARASMAAVALPLALLWLTNAPAAVIGTYGFVLLVTVTVSLESVRAFVRKQPVGLRRAPLFAAATGLLAGLCLAGFYLVPAAYEQRWVQIAMATIPNMRVEDSFLFGHTADAGHNTVLHTVSLIAVLLVAAVFLLLEVGFLAERRASRRRRERGVLPAPRLAIYLEPSGPEQTNSAEPPDTQPLARPRLLFSVIGICNVVLLGMLLPPSLPLWHLLPKLAFLQFPWRLLSLEGVLLGLTVALALQHARLSLRSAALLGVLFAAGMSAVASGLFRQACEPDDRPAARAALLASHHGMPPTDEYTPRAADNDQLRTTDPGYWLAGDAQDFAPNTQPNPGATDPTFEPGDLDAAQTLSSNAPTHLTLHLAAPAILVLNLRDYPAWDVTRSAPGLAQPEHPDHLQRDDGLIAMALPAGESTIDVHWHRTGDFWAGIGLTALGLLLLGCASALSRRIMV